MKIFGERSRKGSAKSPPDEPIEEIILPFVHPQPMPLFALVIKHEGEFKSSLTRKFPDGQSAHCGLCPEGTCFALDDVCMMVVPGHIGDGEGPLFSTHGMPRTPGNLPYRKEHTR